MPDWAINIVAAGKECVVSINTSFFSPPHPPPLRVFSTQTDRHTTSCAFITSPAVVHFRHSAMNIAVSSSPRPWIDAFALPEKINMAVTESDLDPKVRKMSLTFLMTVRAVSWACGHVTEILLILKKIIFDLDMTVQGNVSRFFTGSIGSWNLFQPLGLLWTLLC